MVLNVQVAALLIDEGVANLFLLTDSMTVPRWHIETAIPRKRMGSSTQHDASLQVRLTSIMGSRVLSFRISLISYVVIEILCGGV